MARTVRQQRDDAIAELEAARQRIHDLEAELVQAKGRGGQRYSVPVIDATGGEVG